MVEIKTIYKGEKHCELVHGPSRNKIETDAPKDNNGRGEAFSPTDLVGAALSSCALTVMAIWAEKNGKEINGSWARVEKHMKSLPRQIEKLVVDIHLISDLDQAQREEIKLVAMGCPVKRSLSSEIDVQFSFFFDVEK